MRMAKSRLLKRLTNGQSLHKCSIRQSWDFTLSGSAEEERADGNFLSGHLYTFYSPFLYTKSMIYGYIFSSTDRQTTENQRFEILKFAHEKKLSIGRWIEETVSSTKKLSDRKLAVSLSVCTRMISLSFQSSPGLAAPLLEVMSILHTPWRRM